MNARQYASVIRRDDKYRVQILFVQQLTIVLVRLPVSLLLLESLRHTLHIAVADRDDLAAFGNVIHQLASAAASSDETNDDAIVGSRASGC